jgi:arylsulfatase B
MFIAGPRVTRIGVDDNLINSTDLFATIAELTGVPVKEIHDSKSFTSLLTGTTPIRRYQYADKRNGMADSWTISNGKYKLIVATDGVQKMYDLQSDPYENTDLLTSNLTAETSLAKQELEAELNIIRK